MLRHISDVLNKLYYSLCSNNIKWMIYDFIQMHLKCYIYSHYFKQTYLNWERERERESFANAILMRKIIVVRLENVTIIHCCLAMIQWYLVYLNIYIHRDVSNKKTHFIWRQECSYRYLCVNITLYMYLWQRRVV